jgi:hypothetical protein
MDPRKIVGPCRVSRLPDAGFRTRSLAITPSTASKQIPYARRPDIPELHNFSPPHIDVREGALPRRIRADSGIPDWVFWKT